MTLKEFNVEMRRMNEAYKSYYTPERLKAVWSIVSEMDAKTFAKKIDKALWADYPPKLDWFQTIASHQKSFNNPAPELVHNHANQEAILDLIHSLTKKL